MRGVPTGSDVTLGNRTHAICDTCVVRRHVTGMGTIAGLYAETSPDIRKATR